VEDGEEEEEEEVNWKRKPTTAISEGLSGIG
jgi:hypothetical protein